MAGKVWGFRGRAIMAAALLVGALAACSASGNAEPAKDGHGAASDGVAGEPAPAIGTPVRITPMKVSKTCRDTNLHRSICMIDLALADISAHYGRVSGGGVSGIRALDSTTYEVSLPQEERVDVLTYSFVTVKGQVTMTSKRESVRDF